MDAKLNRRELLRAGFAAAMLGVKQMVQSGDASLQKEVSERTNIVFILADDLGWRDLGCYGSEFYETPNIDRLAKMGMKFTNAYAANPLCSPTRASILTGQYPCRLRITLPNAHLGEELLEPIVPETGPPTRRAIEAQSRNRLPLETYTLAEALKEVGYTTAHFGKWHLGWKPYNPENHGFDFSFPPNQSWPSPPNFFAPFHKEAVKHIPELRQAPEGKHIDEILVEQALKFIREDQSKPFFINFWLFSVHAPFQGRKDLVTKYQQKAQKMPENLRRNPIMGAMVEAMDECVGMLLRGLEEMGLMEKTLIIFTSDNGGNMYDRPSGMTPTDNAPLRNGKASIYEGGTRVPLIFVWQGKIELNSVCDAIVSSIDFYPTILEIAGAKPPKEHIVDGVSLLPVLLGTGDLEREAIFCHFPHYAPATKTVPSVWVRRGDWKLIRFFCDNDDQSDRFELYNLRDDIGEKNNLAEKYPDLVRELNELIENHLRETEALVPVKNPNYRPSIAGWQPSGDAYLSRKEGLLVLESTGGDPFIFTYEVPKARGNLIVRVRMASWSKGIAQVNWATKSQRQFSPDRKIVINPIHDGQWHEYEFKFTCDDELFGLRLDPCSATGTVFIDWIRVYDKDGYLLKAWEF
ncbi:MAG: sulfatase [Armatimonadota bacterium]|nr:sulfatase [Armatimonadota bacterium]MDW8025693.1 sulfatase [Armatimonadota bacterium]MDW8143151.1 sulfatase [Armatimonadota bacterium]